MNQYAQQFVDDGITVIDLSAEFRAWAAAMRAKADEDVKGRTVNSGWFDNGEFQVSPVPRVALLSETLSQILKKPAYPNSHCQLSTVVDGYGSEAPNRHVDGANNELAWSGLLVGINLVSIPADEQAGNLLVWPGTHRRTQARFEALGPAPTKEQVQAAIHPHEEVGAARKLHGPAGTVVLMDHRLEHGMAPHRKSGFLRHVVYFRLPGFTSEPTQVVDRYHFLLNG